MTVKETPSSTTTASVLEELHASYNDAPPAWQGYQPAREPPAYGSFDDAYAHWCAADKAKQAAVALEMTVAAAGKDLAEAKEILRDLKEKSEKAFKASHTRPFSFSSIFPFNKSKGHKKNSSQEVSQPGTTALGKHTTSDDRITEEFKQLHSQGMDQELLVRSIEDRLKELKQEEDSLNKAASSGDIVWVQLRIIGGEALNTPESIERLQAATDKLDSTENAYDLAKKITTDLSRARHAAQSSHRHFSHTLKICDSVRHSPLGALGGAMVQFDMQNGYQECVHLAAKSQVCLNEVVRVLEPHKHLIPEERMVDYVALKEKGLMQMAKIYNLMYGGPVIPSGVAGSVKIMLERQEAAFAHLTYLAVWLQNYVPTCMAQEKLALELRDDTRREVADLWRANIHRR